VGGCAKVPPEAVELSAMVGRDLAEVHRSHVALAERYFDRMERDIQVFLEETYRPFIIRRTMERLDLLNRIEAARAPGSDLDPLDIMEIFATETISQIQLYRDSLMTPIRSQRAQVLGSIEDAYRQIRDANAVLTAHLASVRDVHDAQAEVLHSVGLTGLRERTIEGTARLSEKVADVLRQARDAEGRIEELPDEIRALVGNAGDGG
jgi:hypothetical protein